MAVEPAFDLRPAAKRPAVCVNFPDAGTVSSCQLMLHEGTFQFQTDLPSTIAPVLLLQSPFQSWGKP